MEERANEVLSKSSELLSEIEGEGLFKTLEKGMFAGIKRPINGGKGLAGVSEKSKEYFNPFIDLMLGGDR